MAVLNEITKEKKTQGRQRIEIKKLENGSNKQVTFSKRRSGLFKKAAELSVLCGSEVAALVFSPNDKLFAFGHPSVDSVVLRYAHGTNTAAAAAASTSTNVVTHVSEEFNRDFVEAVKELEAEKTRLAEEKKKAKIGGEKFWWDEGIEGMGMEELRQHMAALIELRRRVAARVQELKAAPPENATSLAGVVPPQPAFCHARLGFGNGNMHF
ncbi:Agamous-like MADS-box protein AGL62 [Morus notabilis]|uniref:Agamous-like MADS-box protein AGL62 n=1 Tax=Morus notabilis TaxID=981085 RepID=W9QWE0_9ROSA|nr:agamous-like MADS-box protein AGL61 [Morus notabilis]EXB55874.1 Agamous-like MADS-box protein AGL62 [Morus notabilis]